MDLVNELLVLFRLLALRPLALFKLFALTPVMPFVCILIVFTAALLTCTRIEATFAPFASVSCVLATLAFLAVFNVLIKDFFWMDIG